MGTIRSLLLTFRSLFFTFVVGIALGVLAEAGASGIRTQWHSDKLGHT